MFTSSLKPTDAYQRVNIETGLDGASPHKLILMLYDGAILAVNQASLAMADKNIPKKGKDISRALDIITNGLQNSLNHEVGGELTERLNALYDYMCNRLLFANLKNDQAALKEVGHLLGELRSAWEEIANDPAVLSQNRAAA
jgi:flagellar secretion chaperone FliS